LQSGGDRWCKKASGISCTECVGAPARLVVATASHERIHRQSFSLLGESAARELAGMSRQLVHSRGGITADQRGAGRVEQSAFGSKRRVSRGTFLGRGL
jgi:hypothetical protein